MGDEGSAWASSAATYDGSSRAAGSTAGGGRDELAERTAMLSARLKQIYKKSVLPVEKRHRYDYFYESPFLTDVEFDCEFSWGSWHLSIWFLSLQKRVSAEY